MAAVSNGFQIKHPNERQQASEKCEMQYTGLAKVQKSIDLSIICKFDINYYTKRLKDRHPLFLRKTCLLDLHETF